MSYKRGDKVRVHDKTFGVKANRSDTFKEIMDNNGIAYVLDVKHGGKVLGLQATPFGKKALFYKEDVIPYESSLEGVEEL